MEAPDWNPNDKSGSLQVWVTALTEEARRQFLTAGTHVEIFFVFNDEGLEEVMPAAGMAKDEMVSALKQLLTESKGYAFIHISEGTARSIDSTDEADILIVHAESRDGFSVAYVSTVAMKGEEKLLLDAVEVDGSRLGGRFSNIFQTLTR
ncbi:MAG TPA: hypothetical protein VIR77_04060 [Pontiella sp.]